LINFVSLWRSVLLDVNNNYHFFRFTSLFPTLHKHPEAAAFLPLDTWLRVSAQPRSSVNLTHWYYCRILSWEITLNFTFQRRMLLTPFARNKDSKTVIIYCRINGSFKQQIIFLNIHFSSKRVLFEISKKRVNIDFIIFK